MAHDYAHRVFSGNRLEKEIDYLTKDAIPPPKPPTPYTEEPEVESENINQSELSFNLSDLSSYILVLANSLRLLKMLVCKHTSLIYGIIPLFSVYINVYLPTFLKIETQEVKPLFSNLENLLLSIIQFTYVSINQQHTLLLESVPYSYIYSIVKDCCEMYLILRIII